MHYKEKLKVPRPSSLSPALMPPIDPPGHASYPSAHATEAWLVARCLKEVMPAEAHDALDRMAERIARNREVLGVHYPCDSAAGKSIATQTFPLLDRGPLFTALKNDAKKEWQGGVGSPKTPIRRGGARRGRTRGSARARRRRLR